MAWVGSRPLYPRLFYMWSIFGGYDGTGKMAVWYVVGGRGGNVYH